ncbi:MAG: hypothetical protein IJA32_09705 [Lachnospiraceae bacterium]|nr:hypothetical protein [Lachnospiraceae bacterium]
MNKEMQNKTEDIKVPKMEIEYPSDAMIKHQKEMILNAAIPKQKTVLERVKDIYWGPGLKVIFYQCSSAWLVTGMVYLLMMFLCLDTKEDVRIQSILALMACPLLYLVFSFVSSWSEEQAEVIELKKTMYYSFTYITSLRMFYSSIVAILFNVILLFFLKGYSAQELWRIGAAAISSMFLFAALSIYLCHKLGNGRYIGVLIAIWCAFCIVMMRTDNNLYHFIFEAIPMAVHVMVTSVCFVRIIMYIRKEGKKYAYTYSY